MPGLQIISRELRASMKRLDSFTRQEQKQIIERLRFDFYMRKGFVPPQLAKLQKLAATAPLSFKFNPYHDPDNGQFTFGPGNDDDSDDDGDDSGSDTTTPVNPDLPVPPLPSDDPSNLTHVADASGQTGSAPAKPQPAKDLSISQQGIDFITQHESFKPTVYLDLAGRPTIGYGHLLQPGESYPNGITRDETEQLLTDDLDTAETAVQNNVKVPLTQSLYDALVSFTYNEGAGAFESSTLLHLLNQGDYNGAANQMPLWHYVSLSGGGHASSTGLINRRTDERNLFLNGNY